MSEDLAGLEAQLRLKMRYGSGAEVRRAAYSLRLRLELLEKPSGQDEHRLDEVNTLVERLETAGFDPLERRIRHWLELFEELSARLRG